VPLVDLLVSPAASPAAAVTADETWDRPVSCPRYRPLAGSRRCEHYVAVGGCELLDIMTCTEWNSTGAGPGAAATASAATALPSAQLPLVEGWAATSSPAPPPRSATDRDQRPPARQPAERPSDVAAAAEPLVGLRPEDLASFKALGVEVCIHSPTLGDVWLVPAYTSERRREITPEHAATLAAIVHAFPGSQPSQWITRSR
jgi:hypothetical protein